MNTSRFLIAPSILSANFARLGAEIQSVLEAGADMIHFDVMDNHYVPNLTIGPLVLESLRKSGITCDMDVHLMVKPVDRLITDFLSAGASIISVHPESTEHLHRTLSSIRDGGIRAGLAFNPATPIAVLEEVIELVDLVLIMSVNPGFGGQSFIPSQLDKIRAVRQRIDALLADQPGRRIDLEVDGGINDETAAQAIEAGADVLVAGTATFAGGVGRYAANIKRLRGE